MESIRRALSQLRGKKTQSLTMKITSCKVNITFSSSKFTNGCLAFCQRITINAMTVNSISESTKDATEFGGPLFN